MLHRMSQKATQKPFGRLTFKLKKNSITERKLWKHRKRYTQRYKNKMNVKVLNFTAVVDGSFKNTKVKQFQIKLRL